MTDGAMTGYITAHAHAHTILIKQHLPPWASLSI